VVQNGAVRAYDNPKDGPYLIFTFSGRFGKATEYSRKEAEVLAAKAFATYGGEALMSKCAINYFAK
jgi:hypothetical protein